MTTTLWTEPASSRIVFFADTRRKAPSVVHLVTSQGCTPYALAELPSHAVEDELPPALLPQVSWLYRFVDGRIEFAPDLAQ